MARHLNPQEIIRLEAAIGELAPAIHTSNDPAWSRPIAVRVIDCVLSLNRNYDAFVVPRLDRFVKRHPDVSSIDDLSELMDRFTSPNSFVESELYYKHADRARILGSVVAFVAKTCAGAAPALHQERLKEWADSAAPGGFRDLSVKGFKLAGWQYLRMLFGADTTKPDKHIIAFVSESVERRVSDVEALRLLETASKSVGLSVRDVDTTVWERRARG